MLRSELGPYGHVRFNLNGDPLFLPAKLAVSLALIFHELATNAGKYGAFSSARGLLQVSWSVSDDRLNVTWDETEGPAVENVGPAGLRHQAAAIGASRVRRQDRDPLPEDRRPLHDAMPDPRELSAFPAKLRTARRNARTDIRLASGLCYGVDILLMTIERDAAGNASTSYGCRGFSQFHLTNTTRDFAKLRGHA